jgi:hypothetical protein
MHRSMAGCALLALLLLVPSCASRDARLREDASDLMPGQWREDSLHCDRDRCVILYRLVVEKPATIVVEADAPADPLLPDFFLALEDPEGRVIGDDRAAQKRPRRIVGRLDPGLYFVRVAAATDKDDQLSFKLRFRPEVAKVAQPKRAAPKTSAPKPTPAPRPPPPRPVHLESEILEVERDGGEPTAILLEAGTSQGVQPGQSGELIEAGQVIGRIEIVDVYSAGSRARIVGGLRSPITLETRARLAR